MNTMEIGEKLKAYFSNKSITQTQIAEALNVSQSYVNMLLSGKKAFGKKNAQIFGDKFGLSPIWLLTGEGEMLKESAPREAEKKPRTEGTSGDYSEVPLLPISAHGGKLDDFVMGVTAADCEKIVASVKGADMAIRVTGDSMSPEYPNGSQVLIKKINEKSFIDWGRAYVLDTVNGTVIKILIPSENEGYVRCRSLNPDPIYAPFDIALTDIYGVYAILMCMSLK